MRLVTYGDFNCPFSALASIRVASLEQAGSAEVDWRAGAHDPEIPALGESLGSANARAYEVEVDQVYGLLLDDETIKLRVPTVRANTAAATAAYAATEARTRTRVRIELFRAHWEDGKNRGLGRLDVYRDDDVGARNKLQRFLDLPNPPTYPEIIAILAPWYPYAGMIYFHLLLDGLAERGSLEPGVG